jgi:tRNA pseudouridine38-40 synthase
VGVIAEVGRGKLTTDEVRGFLRVRSDRPARLTAPPSGLFLERVIYPGEKLPERLEAVVRVG